LDKLLQMASKKLKVNATAAVLEENGEQLTWDPVASVILPPLCNSDQIIICHT
jgi:hypothetical protein